MAENFKGSVVRYKHIENMKEIFVKKSRSSPEPIITRYETWLDVVNYYCIVYREVEKIFNRFDVSYSVAIKTVQTLF